MSTAKKLILFIVEGISDEESLGYIFSKILNEAIRFQIVGTDITTRNSTNSQNVINKVTDEVKTFLEKNKMIKKSDILEIVHLVDTDGAYIPDSLIIEDSSLNKIRYTTTNIFSNNKNSIIERNLKKSNLLNKLSTTSKIYNINYSVYYFSTNLEHVLHDIQCVNDEEKMIYAQKFTDRFFKREIEFIAFINDPSFAVSGDYRSSWDFIKKDANSLNRYSNLHLFLADKVKSRK
ncbi:MAG: hypothetical protein ACLUPE_07935 [Turicibacter sanguinis]|uniref:hypothetical protein n=1 Tax=Turicibacter sanguinis TaxID=154288 RepID=UPI003995ED35